MSPGYQIKDHQAPHFITGTTVQWIDVFTRPLYKDAILDSLRYCQNEKGLIIYAWVIMTNHIHLIASAAEKYNLSNILRDFKKYTSKEITQLVANNIQESRKSWLLWLIRSNGIKNNNNKDFQFWQQKNHPVELSNAEMVRQRLDYLHDNPVKAGIVREPHHYLYSSAIDYAGGKGLLDIKFII